MITSLRTSFSRFVCAVPIRHFSKSTDQILAILLKGEEKTILFPSLNAGILQGRFIQELRIKNHSYSSAQKMMVPVAKVNRLIRISQHKESLETKLKSNEKQYHQLLEELDLEKKPSH